MNSYHRPRRPNSQGLLAAALIAFAVSPAFAQDGLNIPPAAPVLGDGAQPAPPAMTPPPAPAPVSLPQAEPDAAIRADIETIGRMKAELERLRVTRDTKQIQSEIAEFEAKIQEGSAQNVEAELRSRIESENREYIAGLEQRIAALMAEKAPAQEEASVPPVVSSITGGARPQAVVLVPYTGAVTVQAGDRLPNGMRVLSIDETGVRVSSPDGPMKLGFGTSVPLARQAPAAAPAADPRAFTQGPSPFAQPFNN